MSDSQNGTRVNTPDSVLVLSLPLHTVDCGTAAGLILEWALRNESRVACAANVHMVMEARDDPRLRDKLKGSDLSVPDGMPLVWALRAVGERVWHVRGADLARELCRRAQDAGVPIGLYGATPATLAAFQHVLREDYPALQISFAASPPFRQLTEEEDRATIEAIRESGVRILLVGLGCPKQELWMMEHRGQLQCVMLGIGAAFDFLAGTKPQAPRWMQRFGLEWTFRLLTDPRRLWRRYLKHNPRFLGLLAIQWLRHLFGKG